MKTNLKNILLNINSGYTFFVSSIHMGLMTSLVLFWYSSWAGLTIDTIQNNFSIPAIAATKLFVILIPVMMITSTIMIITEWKTPLIWPSIVVLIGIMGSTAMAKYFIFPINDIIYAGVKTNAELKVLLIRWMGLNNWRVFFSVLTWFGMFTYYTMKAYRKSS
jgi:hypothetical protein